MREHIHIYNTSHLYNTVGFTFEWGSCSKRTEEMKEEGRNISTHTHTNIFTRPQQQQGLGGSSEEAGRSERTHTRMHCNDFLPAIPAVSPIHTKACVETMRKEII